MSLINIYCQCVVLLGLEYYCRGCFKETLEMVSEKGWFQWRRRLLLLSGLHSEVLIAQRGKDFR